MAKLERKEEILSSELPSTLPLMALRSTIVSARHHRRADGRA